jgi:DNA-directed RNA polymerase specialized sigma24 family protein
MFNHSDSIELEESLGELVKNGNRQSFGELYDKYAPALLGVILRLTNNKKQAEDILLAVFVNAWNQIRCFNKSKTTLFIWLLHITRSTALDILGSGGIKNPSNLNMAGTVSMNDISSSNGQNQQAVFDLVYFKGLGYAEAAAALNIPGTLVIGEIKKAIQKVKKNNLIC